LWAIKAGGTGFDKGLDIEIDAFENIYVSGISSSSPLAFGGLMVQFNGDISFISKISSEGQFLEVAKINTNNIMSMKTTKSGNLFIAGLLGFSSFGTITLTQIGGGDIYI